MITSKRIKPIINRYEELISLTEQFVQEKTKSHFRDEVRIDGDEIQHEINTSCNCHPEYGWNTIGTIEELGKWINERNKI